MNWCFWTYHVYWESEILNNLLVSEKLTNDLWKKCQIISDLYYIDADVSLLIDVLQLTTDGRWCSSIDLWKLNVVSIIEADL